jgi:DNA polymerase-4
VVVGGSPEARGVVAAASYDARAFGVRSAMPMSRAMRLCPEAVRVSPRFDRYGQMSRVVMGLFRALTPLVEPLSLDEAFLDISAIAADDASAERVAARLKQRVKAATGLTLSVGGGANKSVAKIASDMRKPDGLLIVPHGTEAEFLAPLPVRLLWGVGPKTEKSLVAAGIRTIGDLAARSDADAERWLGSRGTFLLEMARGIDDRGIETESERKSIGAETTFARDLADGPELRDELHRVAEEVGARMARSSAAARTVAIKLRYANFRKISRQSSQKATVSSAAVIEAIATVLFDDVAREGDQFRLLGIQCSNLVEGGTQGILLDADV